MYSESIKNDEIQRVTGANRQECLDKIRDMYGTSFLILNTQRKLKPGFLGFFQKDVLEMTYQVINKSSKPSPVNQEKGRFGSFENSLHLIPWVMFLLIQTSLNSVTAF